ncbi:YoaK family protein [Sphingomonas sp. CARO-RG-8B-R24-01]|uniref:YoaK family protein n=1 Tax=Sphingomonas sp. CARO-RG-8B-R24-01 TaxID=2914831 RepID=UPI001F5AC99C|nr:YoaK family protein [Sphingomonas sp. CARO-RG-8B-R24-01]
MTRYSTRVWLLAAGTSSMAGYVDAVGFLKLGGLFVSFMSGNSTRLAVGLVVDPYVARVAIGLLGAFVGGVVLGTLIAAAAGVWRKPVILLVVGALLAVAGWLDLAGAGGWATPLMAAAMGCVNTTFQRAGEVSIGVTYMTGTLVKFGQRLADAMLGGARWAWAPYLALWLGLVGGAVVGSLMYRSFGTASIWGAAGAAVVLAIYAGLLGPAEPSRARAVIGVGSGAES